MGISFIILFNLVVLSSVIGYFAFRLGHKFWVFFIISLILSPVLGALFLAIWDYYNMYMKGNR